MRAILTQVGAPVRLWRGGRWTTAPGWTGTRSYALEPGLTRRAAFIGAPDLALFPARYGARSVLFRAGLELRVMHEALAALGWLRRRGLAPDPARLTPLLWRIASWLKGFGADRGGMVVIVTGITGDGVPERRSWTLVAEGGDGPFIPAVPAVIVLGKLAEGRLAAGARPALDAFTLPEAEVTLSRLRVRFHRSAAPAPTLFQKALGATFRTLPPEVQALHSVQDQAVYEGRASVGRGISALARMIAWIFRFPPEAGDIPVSVTMSCIGGGEVWERNFAGKRFRSHLSEGGPGRFRERFGPFTFELALPVADGALGMPVRRGWFLGVPLPRAMAPRSDTREYAEDGRFHFDVRLSIPFGGLIVRYRGWLEPAGG